MECTVGKSDSPWNKKVTLTPAVALVTRKHALNSESLLLLEGIKHQEELWDSGGERRLEGRSLGERREMV